jgi:predicted nucleotide-binding protein
MAYRMSIQVLFKATIKNPVSKDAIVSEMDNLKLLPYSAKKLGEDEPDRKYITCMSLFPNLDAATVITLVRDRMNSISSIHGIRQVDILHAAKQEEAEEGQNKDVFIIHGRDKKNALRLKSLLRKWNLNGIILKLRPKRGKTIIEKFEMEARKACYAFAILTADDTIRYLSRKYKQARPNVFFELGWFYGKIGRDNVCILFKKGGRIHSDLQGVSLIKFDRDISDKRPQIKQKLQAAQMVLRGTKSCIFIFCNSIYIIL